MKSFCIKTNNRNIQNYLLNEFLNLNLDSFYVSQYRFSKYENIIVHYKGKNLEYFYGLLSDILTNCILYYFEDILIKKLINFNYFYFSELEKRQISVITSSLLDSEEEYFFRDTLVYQAIYEYIAIEKSMILEGFVFFRLFEYIKLLDKMIDSAVNQFLIQKEYFEFIHLLKVYIASSICQVNSVHLIYNHSHNFLLDENYNIIPIKEDLFQAKYISDITFSENDYILNTLLSILPQKITVHSSLEDEFIHTLKLIFEDRISICTDCSICHLYQISKNKNSNFLH